MHRHKMPLLSSDRTKVALLWRLSPDLSLDQLMGLFNQYRQADLQLELGQLQGQGQTINGIYYDIPVSTSLAELRKYHCLT